MHCTFFIWKDQIFLKWDGTPPNGCSIPANLLQSQPEVVLAYWPEIGPYARYSKRLKSFYMSFSKQNLQRLRKQFGEITIEQGSTHINNIKELSRSMSALFRQVDLIKNGNTEDINYKVPPLGNYQHIGVNILTRCKKVPLFADCGMGKSYMTLVSTQEQFRRGILTPGKTLVVAKLATLFNGWKDDCAKFTYMKCNVVWVKAGSKRKEKLRAILADPADIYVINHDGVRVLEEDLVKKNFEKIIVDESTILKGFMGDRFGKGAFGKSLMRVAHSASWRVIMSGTPAPNGPQDLWGQFHFLDPEGLLLERTIHDFRQSFMKEIFFGDPSNPNTPKTWVPKATTAKEVGDLVNPISYRVRIRDHLKDLPEKTVMNRVCTMTKEQSTHYNMMEKTMMTVIDNEVVAASIALAKLAKLRQITSGFILDQGSEAHQLTSNPKLELLDDLLLDEINTEDKVVIYAQHRWEIEMIASRYKKMGVCTIYGGNAAHVNLDNIERFISDPEIRIAVLHPKSAAHGITFVVAHYMIFYSISYSAEEDYQSVARIERAGQKHPMFIYYLLCDESIDLDIFDVLRAKKHDQQELIDADIINRVRNRMKQSVKAKGSQ